MSTQHRIKRLEQYATGNGSGPLTVILIEAKPGEATGQRSTHDGLALEIVYDPASGMPPLPPHGPHKIVIGTNIYDLV